MGEFGCAAIGADFEIFAIYEDSFNLVVGYGAATTVTRCLMRHSNHPLLRIAGRIARPPGKALRRNLDPVL